MLGKMVDGSDKGGTRAAKAAESRVLSWQYVVPVLLGVLFGLCTYASYNQGQVDLLSAKLFVLIVMFSVMFVAAFAGVWMVIGDHRSRDHRGHHKHDVADEADDNAIPANAAAIRPGLTGRIRRLYGLDWSLRGTGIAAATIMVCWLPYLVLSYPGIYWWDTTLQMTQALSDPLELWDQHPFVDSLLFGMFEHLGILLWNNALGGLFVLIVLQSIAAAAALGSAVTYMDRYGVGWGWRFATLVLFALCPAFPRMFGTLAKDTIFAPLFVVFVIMFGELMRTGGRRLMSVGFVIPFWLVCVAMGVSKKTGALIVLGAMCLLVFSRLKVPCKAACVVLGVSVILVSNTVIPQVGARYITIEPGREQESLALLLQQVAKAEITDPDSFSESEREFLRSFYATDVDGLASAYLYTAADPIKDPVQITPETKSAFLRIWMKHAVINPQAYVSAAAGLNAGWFSFPTADGLANTGGADIDIPSDSQHHYDDVTTVPGWDKFAKGSAFLAYMDAVEHLTPVLNVLLTKALWGGILPFLCLFLAVSRRRGERWQALVWLGPMLLTMASLYVGPTSLYQEATRYVFPLMCTMPLFVVMAMRARSESGAGGIAPPKR
ncbi:DUF6020 family protein [Bifidobacterium moraviense]|uniref:DUF6020 family protein n=1 Tax=Bifidobacterium moraviense TaxID=2675323 RepID=UPI002FF8C817